MAGNSSAIELDVEPAERMRPPKPAVMKRPARGDVADHCAKKACASNRIPCGALGPPDPESAFDWPSEFLDCLRSKGVGLFGIDLAECLQARLACGLRVNTDYSGMGGPEHALHEILAACGCQDHDGSPTTVMRAGDISSVCRQVLLHVASDRSGLGPQCVFGDILDRCPVDLLRRASDMAARYMVLAHERMDAGEAKHEVIRSCGMEFLQRASEFMLDVRGVERATCRAFCFRHHRDCCSGGDIPHGFLGNVGCIAGINCYDWSSMGAGEGWLGKSAVIYLAFLREVRIFEYDWLILECTANFDEDGLSPLRDRYDAVTLKFSPVMLGFPANRMRKYMLLIHRDRFRWSPDIAAVGHAAAFQAIFARKVRMKGVDLLRAPEDHIARYLQRLVSQRQLPERAANGKPWDFIDVIPPSYHKVVSHHHEEAKDTCGECPELLCNAMQSVSFMGRTEMVPALLRRSFLWSMKARRPLLATEHFEVMGYRMFGPRACKAADVLFALSEKQQRELSGNGMHAAAIGSAMMFLLACIEPTSRLKGSEL